MAPSWKTEKVEGYSAYMEQNSVWVDIGTYLAARKRVRKVGCWPTSGLFGGGQVYLLSYKSRT